MAVEPGFRRGGLPLFGVHAGRFDSSVVRLGHRVVGFDALSGKRLWEVANPREEHFFALAFAPEGDAFVCGGWDFRATMYRLEDRKKLASVYIGPETEDHVGGQTVRNIAFAPDGRTVAFCSDDRAVHLWARDAATRVRVEDEVEVE